MLKRKVCVLIVDDSASVRQILTSILNEDPDIEVMAAASGGWVLGFLVGAEVGPTWLLCARAALRSCRRG